MFLRKTRLEALPVTMSAVRMGERVLQVGVDDPATVSAIAAKLGLSGHAAISVADEREAARANSAAADAGLLVEVKVSPPISLPFESDAFDLVIVHSAHGRLSSLNEATRDGAAREWHRVLRRGGRVMTIEAGPASGISAMFRPVPRHEAYEAAGGAVGALEAAGFRPVRLLAEREGYRFSEGIKT
jgi:SAM-dependent methyltransferase